MAERNCPCLTWAYDPNAHGEWDFTTPHHPACDGAGNNRLFAWVNAPEPSSTAAMSDHHETPSSPRQER